MRRLILLITFSFLFFSELYATAWIDKDKDKDKSKDKGLLIDTSYIQLFSTRFGIRPKIRTNNRIFNFGAGQEFFRQTSYLPLVGGMTLTLFDFDLSFAINKTKVITNGQNKEETDYKDFSFNYYNNQMVFEFYYREYRGMYNRYEIKNNAGIFQKYRVFDSTLVETAVGINANIVPNNKHFSYKAAFYNSAIQKKTAGSFITCLSFRSITLESKKPGKYIIPKFRDTKFGSFQGLVKYSQQSIIFPKFGYAFNIVHKKFYFAPAIMASIWAPRQTLVTEEKTAQSDTTGKISFKTRETKLNAAMFETSVNILTGINFNRWYYGLYSGFEYNLTSNKYFNIYRYNYNYGFFMGFRIIKYKLPKKKKYCCLY